uniref:Uncharacterized protein n=1 Tax=Guadeloupe mosquito mononega-like virus TaxID=2607732 RepID=A0A5C1K3B1_9MONO|nr:hypothetical protein [Guadeloupe mosquito mononega-like virus]
MESNIVCPCCGTRLKLVAVIGGGPPCHLQCQICGQLFIVVTK